MALTSTHTHYFLGAFDAGEVSGASQTDFPALITEASLTTAQRTELFSVARSDGADLRVASAADGFTEYPSDLAAFDSAAETFSLFVKVPALSGATDTGFALFAGDAAASLPAADAANGREAVWDETQAAYNLLTDLSDSSGNATDVSGQGETFDADGLILDGTASTAYDIDALTTQTAGVLSMVVTVGSTSGLQYFVNGSANINRMYVGVDGDELFARVGNGGNTTGGSVALDETYVSQVEFDSGDWTAYKNGVEVMSGTYTGSVFGNAARFGGFSTTSALATGKVRDFRVYTSTKSTDWYLTEAANYLDPGSFSSFSTSGVVGGASALSLDVNHEYTSGAPSGHTGTVPANTTVVNSSGVTVAASTWPRITHDGDGSNPRALFEQDCTQYMASQDDLTQWSTSSVTVVDLGLDGVYRKISLQGSGSTSDRISENLSPSITLAAGERITLSWVYDPQSNIPGQISIVSGGGGALVRDVFTASPTLISGIFSLVGAFQVETLRTDMAVASVTLEATGAVTATQVRFSTRTTDTALIGYLYGVNLTNLPFPTSFITGASRTADTYNAVSLTSRTEGLLAAKVKYTGPLSAQDLTRLQNTTSGAFIALKGNDASPGTIGGRAFDGTAEVANLVGSKTGAHNVNMTFDDDDFAVTIDGAAQEWDRQSASDVGSLDELVIYNGVGVLELYALTVGNARVSNTDLASETPGAWPASGVTGYTLSVDEASYAVVGQDVTLLSNRSLVADTAPYTLEGQGVSLLLNRTINAGTADYTLVLRDTDTNFGRLISLSRADYVLGLSTAGLLFSRVMTPNSASYSFDFSDALLTLSQPGAYVLSTNTAVYTVNNSAQLLYGRRLDAGALYTSWAQENTGLLHGRRLDAESASNSVSLVDVMLSHTQLSAYTLVAETADFQVPMHSVGLVYSGFRLWAVQPTTTTTWTEQ